MADENKQTPTPTPTPVAAVKTLPSRDELRKKLTDRKAELIAKYSGQRGHNVYVPIARDIEPVLLKLNTATTKVDEAIVAQVNAALDIKLDDVKFFDVPPAEEKKKPVAS